MNCRIPEFLGLLGAVMLDVANDCNVRGVIQDSGEVNVDGRPLAESAIAVRDWVTYFGSVLNVNPNLEPYRRIDGLRGGRPMTSLERERRLAVNPVLVRQRVIERTMERFGFSSVDVFHEHPELPMHRPLPFPPRGPDGEPMFPRPTVRVDEPVAPI
jgi:lipoyl(octanoyl) transferase